MPYVEVGRIGEVTDRARRLGGSVLLEPRECVTGWRSVVSTVQVARWPSGSPNAVQADEGDLVDETELLAAAQDGDEDAYAQLVGVHRPALHAHCYRMLGSVLDAEDALQETLLRAWRGLPPFEGRSSLRSWLYTIATNACLKAIQRRPSRALPVDFGPAGDRTASSTSRWSSRCGCSPTRTSGSSTSNRLPTPATSSAKR